jgi:hypothetical protein
VGPEGDARGDGVRIALGEASKDSIAATPARPRRRRGALHQRHRAHGRRRRLGAHRLSDSLRTAVREEVGTAIPGDTADQGIGGLVGRVVARSVDAAIGTAMGTVVRIPVSEIQDARCDGGRLRFRTRDGKDGGAHVNIGGKHRATAATRERDKDDGLRFAEADCHRLVEAVTARQADRPAGGPARAPRRGRQPAPEPIDPPDPVPAPTPEPTCGTCASPRAPCAPPRS